MRNTKKILRNAIESAISDFEEDLDVNILNEYSVKTQLTALINVIAEVLEDQEFEESEEVDLFEELSNELDDDINEGDEYLIFGFDDEEEL